MLRFGMGKDYIRPCNFVFVKNELDLTPELHYDYLMKSNPNVPGMILSVHGTGISESLDGGYAASLVVKEQIYKAAESTGSWITTSGMNDPLNNLIGSARFEVGRQTGDKVPIIGFPFWEAIKEKNAMKVHKSSEAELQNNKEIIISSQTNSLDKNHSQFLIFEGKSNPKNPQLNNFRFHVEMKFKDEGDGIPVANILVSGDLNSLKSIILRLHEDTPVIVFRGAGGAADVLANSLEFLAVKASEIKYSNYSTDTSFDSDSMTETLIDGKIPDACDRLNERIYQSMTTLEMMEILKKTCVKRRSAVEVKKWIEDIKKIFLMRKHITIYNLKQKKKLSHVLMENVLKDDSVRQLFVAMQMNLTSVVKDQLSKINIKGYQALFTTSKAHEMFFGAIADNNIAFVSIFLEQGIELSMSEEMDGKIVKFFNDTREKLPQLFNQIKKHEDKKRKEELLSPRKNFLGKKKLKELEKLVSTEFSVFDLISGLRHLKKSYISNYGVYIDDQDPMIRGRLHPVKALFLWSLATENFEMAEIFWRESQGDSLVLALVGAAACDFISKLSKTYDTKNVIATHKKKFTDLAIGLLSDSIKIDNENTRKFLTQIHPEYGQLTPLEIAVNGNVIAFVAHSFVQNELDTIWLGRISKLAFESGRNREWVYYSSLLIPFCAPLWLKFDTVKQTASYLTKLRCFFNAPRTVYVYNFILYTIYQGLFGFVLTMQFCTRPVFAEWVLLGWTITLVLEEFRQMKSSGKDSKIINKIGRSFMLFYDISCQSF